jgi:hypothetical protein
MRKKIVIAAVAGQLVGLLGWIDPLFIPFVLVGPLVVGAVAAARQLPLVPVMVLWASAGINMLWTDWLVNRADLVFHAVLSVVMALLAAAGWGIVTGLGRLRHRPAAV